MLWPSLTYGNKFTFVVICVITSALIIDTSIIKVYYFNAVQSSDNSSVIIFIVISFISLIGQYLVLEYVKKNSREIRNNKKLHLGVLHKAVALIQYGLIAINVILILQMVTVSRYYVAYLVIATGMSYGLSITLMTILAHRFFSWFKSNKNNVVLLYALSSVLIGLNGTFTLTYIADILLNEPALVYPHPGFNTPFLVGTPLAVTLTFGYIASSIASFSISWFATALLLHHYSRKFGAIRFWFVVSVPLIYFLIQFLPSLLDLFLSLSQSEPIVFGVLYTLIFTMSKLVGGVLFGIAFWIITRRLPRTTIIRRYMIMSAFGFVLLFVSNQGVVLVSSPYPPFGLPTISFFGLASYLLIAGIYSSAISVAEDSKLRQSIRSFAIEESRLLDSIGTAHMEQEIQRKVLEVVRTQQEALSEQGAVQPSLTDDDVKEYLAQVMKEIKKPSRNDGQA
jgi:hypothetical protein